LDDYDFIKKNYPNLDSHFFEMAINSVSHLILPIANAASEVILSNDVKNNKSLDYIGDLDKLGIVGGAAGWSAWGWFSAELRCAASVLPRRVRETGSM
jgi:hypothetical protein